MPKVPDTPCGSCGKLLYKGKGSLPAPICRECRKSGAWRHSPRGPKPRTCGTCGESFIAPNRGRWAFCSAECRTAAIPLRECETCGAMFRVRPKAQRWCSLSCRPQSVLPTKRPLYGPPAPKVKLSEVRSLIWIRDCKRCGQTFVARQRNKVFCSTTCRVGDTSDRIVALYAAAIENGGPGGARWRKTLCELLAERYGQDCWICGGRVNLNLSSGPKGDDDGPSVDHLVPRSLAGRDELTNLRLAHWRCNRDRGNSVTTSVDGVTWRMLIHDGAMAGWVRQFADTDIINGDDGRLLWSDACVSATAPPIP